MNPESKPELFFGLVGPIGTDLTLVEKALTKSLEALGYHCTSIRLVDLIEDELEVPARQLPVDECYKILMQRGTEFCENEGAKDALAALGVATVPEFRQRISSLEPDSEGIVPPLSAHAYIFRSLKRKEEVEALREIYGRSFFLIAAYSPLQLRAEQLAKRIADSRKDKQPEAHLATAYELIATDKKEEGKPFGQRIKDTFPLADVFVEVGSRNETLHTQIERFIELLFGRPCITPTKEEYGMFQAYGAALRSAALGRQVGCAIAGRDGEIVALGVNEVPKANGGSYWSDDEIDHRDHVVGEDSNDVLKKMIFEDIVDRLNRAAKDELPEVKTFLARFESDDELLEGAYFRDLIEFGRAVHAEMAAIVDAARRGVSVQDHVLYVTTFPCHECTRHIIASGIDEVVFIQPYAKSLAKTLHRDSVMVDEACNDGARILFRPFVGIAPRLYLELFRKDGDRKDKAGNPLEWYLGFPYPRLNESAKSYLYKEVGYASSLGENDVESSVS